MLGILFPSDERDPVRHGYRLLFRKLRNVVLVVSPLIVMVIFWGVPSIQGDYRSYKRNGTPTARDKTSAVYYTPFFGTRVVAANEYGPGCPVVIFVPLRDCANLSPYENSITTFLLPKEFFHGTESE